MWNSNINASTKILDCPEFVILFFSSRCQGSSPSAGQEPAIQTPPAAGGIKLHQNALHSTRWPVVDTIHRVLLLPWSLSLSYRLLICSLPFYMDSSSYFILYCFLDVAGNASPLTCFEMNSLCFIKLRFLLLLS